MKAAAKSLVRILCAALTWPLAWAVRASGSEGLFTGIGQALALAPGAPGSYLRVAFLRRTLESASPCCHVGFGSYFSKREASMGEGVYIGAYCIIGMADIGSHATIASRVSVLSGKRQHNFHDASTPVQEQGGEFGRVRLGRNCWIGEGSVVMADIGDGCVVGAGSVVNKPQPGRTVAAGNPARTVRVMEEAA